MTKPKVFKASAKNRLRPRQDKDKCSIIYSSSSPLENVVRFKRLDFHECLVFFLAARQQLAENMIQTLPSEMYQIIFSLPCTTKTKLLQKINLLYSYPIGAHRVKLPHNWGILPSIKHILTLDTRKSEKKKSGQ